MGGKKKNSKVRDRRAEIILQKKKRRNFAVYLRMKSFRLLHHYLIKKSKGGKKKKNSRENILQKKKRRTSAVYLRMKSFRLLHHYLIKKSKGGKKKKNSRGKREEREEDYDLLPLRAEIKDENLLEEDYDLLPLRAEIKDENLLFYSFQTKEVARAMVLPEWCYAGCRLCEVGYGWLVSSSGRRSFLFCPSKTNTKFYKIPFPYCDFLTSYVKTGSLSSSPSPSLGNDFYLVVIWETEGKNNRRDRHVGCVSWEANGDSRYTPIELWAETFVFGWEKSDGKYLYTYGSTYEEGSIGFREDEVFQRCGANIGGNIDGCLPLRRKNLLPSSHLSSLKVELKNSRRFSFDVGKTSRLSRLRREELKNNSRKFSGKTSRLSRLKHDFPAVHWPSICSLEQQLSLLRGECDNSGRFACVVGKNILSTRPQRDQVSDVRFYRGHFYFVTAFGRVAKLDRGLPSFAQNFKRALETDYDPNSFMVASVISRAPHGEMNNRLHYLVESSSGDLLFVTRKKHGSDKVMMQINTDTGALSEVAGGVDCHFVGRNNTIAYDATKFEKFLDPNRIYSTNMIWIRPDTIF